jgi:hypothetical protein
MTKVVESGGGIWSALRAPSNSQVPVKSGLVIAGSEPSA